MAGNTIPNNEEIVNELSKDLESNLRTNDEENNAKIPEDFENPNNDDDKDVVEDDFIDEEKLKDEEVSLTEEEKATRHEEALKFKEQGNKNFKEQRYLESIESYTKALRLCPLKYAEDRAVFYGNRAASKVKIERKKSAIDDCTKALELNDKYVKVLERRAKLYEQEDKLDESLEDFKKILEIDRNHEEALRAQYRLPPLIQERNEKLKTEMMGKLKDLGNLVLRPFGLSTDNFQLNQNPDGSYSMGFNQQKHQ